MNSRRPRAGLAVRAWPLRRNGLRFGSGVQPVAVSRPVPVRYGDCETRTPLFCARADPARGTHGRGCSGARSGLEERRLSWWSDGVAGRARGNPCRIRTPICGRLDTRGNPGFRSRPTVGPPPTGKMPRSATTRLRDGVPILPRERWGDARASRSRIAGLWSGSPCHGLGRGAVVHGVARAATLGGRCKTRRCRGVHRSWGPSTWLFTPVASEPVRTLWKSPSGRREGRGVRGKREGSLGNAEGLSSVRVVL